MAYFSFTSSSFLIDFISQKMRPYRFRPLLTCSLLLTLLSSCGSSQAPEQTPTQTPRAVPTVLDATRWAVARLSQPPPWHLDSLLQFGGHIPICDSASYLYHYAFPTYNMVIQTTAYETAISIDSGDSGVYRKRHLPVNWRDLTTAFQQVRTPPSLTGARENDFAQPKRYQGTVAYTTPGTTDTLKIAVMLGHEPTTFPNVVEGLWLDSHNIYLDTLALKHAGKDR